jgi:hypothetical protein
MKTLLIILVLFEVFLLVLAFSPIFVDRQNAAQAFVEWHNNLTPQNEAAWLREKTTMNRERLLARVCVIGALTLNTVGLVLLGQRIRRQSKNLGVAGDCHV